MERLVEAADQLSSDLAAMAETMTAERKQLQDYEEIMDAGEGSIRACWGSGREQGAWRSPEVCRRAVPGRGSFAATAT